MKRYGGASSREPVVPENSSNTASPELRPPEIDVNANEITRESKSNLALAFISLGRERRRDMTTFYAFCRIVDDIADTDSLTPAQKQEQLAKWRKWLRTGTADEPALAPELRELLT